MNALRRWIAAIFGPVGPPSEGGAVGPSISIRYEATVAARDEMTSPLTGQRGVCVVVEVLERLRPDEIQGEDGGVDPDDFVRYHPVRTVNLGGPIVLTCDDGIELTLSSTRASFVFATVAAAVTPLLDAPPELGPLEANGRTRFFREQAVRAGDRFRIRATIEERPTVVGSGYRSGVGTQRVVREDLGGVVLEEVLAVPDW